MVLVALGSGPVFCLFVFFLSWLFCVVMRGSMRISDQGKCISTQRMALLELFVFLPPIRVQSSREILLSLFTFFDF